MRNFLKENFSMTRMDIIESTQDYAKIFLGIALFSVGYTCLLLPYQIISGGVSGVATLLFYLTGMQPDITYMVINMVLLLMAFRILGWNYCFKTVVATVIISFLIGILQQRMTIIGSDGKETLRHILGEQRFMACVIGGILEGSGLATIFLAGGSTGGSDIIASSINKYWNISLGRLLLMIDVVVVGSSYLISQDIELVVTGYITMFISTYMIDRVINSARQSVQFMIVSEKYEDIAHEINHRLNRGVTVLYGEGFYSHEKRKVLLILAKKFESRRIFQIIKRTDSRAFVSMSNVEGVFGEGFDAIKR